jgi:NAD(P)-dependent dehydrogenase (short-subunit alcohol dehydrogenase family)
MSPGPVLQGLTEPAHALVTGASSGIGLAVVRELLADEGVACVHAVARGAGQSAALAALAEAHGERLLPVSTDLTSADALQALAAHVARRSDALHLVFNAAGVLHGPGLRPEKSLTSLRSESLAQVFALNAFAPVLLVQALLPLLRHRAPIVLASLSARVGSIGDNHLGGWYAYRASKAAQNQLFRTLAVELRRTHPNATCVLLHPGTVDTPLSQPFQGGVPAGKLFSPEFAARQLLAIVARMTPADSGRFYAWDGSEVPW